MKIPKPRQRGMSWYIEFMYLGSRYYSTHDTPTEAKEWAAREMLRVRALAKAANPDAPPQHSLSELAAIYMRDVSTHKKGGAIEKRRITVFLQDHAKLADTPLSKIGAKELIAWRNSRLKVVQPATVRREMNLLSAIFNHALKELLWIELNPFARVARPKSADPRNRRISTDEITAILLQCDYLPGTKPINQRHYVAWCFLLAIETGMRAGEILSLTWPNIKSNYIHLPKTKNGTARNVPLLDTAIELLELARGIDEVRVIPLSSDSLKNIFRRVVASAGINDLTFHDTRHEATTRLAQLLDVKDLSKVTGHKDIGILINTYYNPTIDELSAKLRRKKPDG